MSKRSIEIDRLELRLKGISPEAARAAADGLGQELLQRLASLPDAGTKKGVHRIGEIDSGALKLSNGTSSGELRNAIAQKISGSIQSKLSSRDKPR
ncbi:MAG: hypothetical protein ACXW18_12945 [Pyrinomonadaceae bacterium]